MVSGSRPRRACTHSTLTVVGVGSGGAALIIAAGRGSRPSAPSVGLPTTLVYVLGVPIIDRVQGRIVDIGKDISRWNAPDIRRAALRGSSWSSSTGSS